MDNWLHLESEEAEARESRLSCSAFRERFNEWNSARLVSHSDQLRLMALTALNTIQVLDRLYPANEAVAAVNVKTPRHPPWSVCCFSSPGVSMEVL